jgi:hypothetical protein
MLGIAEWKQRYEVSIKGREPVGNEELRAGPLSYIRLKVFGHKQGTGFRRLKQKAGKRVMEVFGIFCKFLEISGNQPRERRGWLLNEHNTPATVEDLAFILDIDPESVENAVNVLLDLGWLYENESPHTPLIKHNVIELNSTQGAGDLREIPEVSGNNNNNNDDKIGSFTEKLIQHWNDKCLIKCESRPEQLAVQRQFAATKLSLPQEELLTAIDYYAEACALPDSQAFKKWTLYQWLLKGHYNKFLPGQFNIENYRKSNFEKVEKGSAPAPVKKGADGLTPKQQLQERIQREAGEFFDGK